MARPPLPEEVRARGRLLGELLRSARGERTVPQISAASGVPAETLRKIESGRIPTPAFFTVVALANALDLPLTDLVTRCAAPAPLAEGVA